MKLVREEHVRELALPVREVAAVRAMAYPLLALTVGGKVQLPGAPGGGGFCRQSSSSEDMVPSRMMTWVTCPRTPE